MPMPRFVLCMNLFCCQPGCITDLQGEARVRTLTYWCQLLTQLHPDNLPADQYCTLNAVPPGSPQPNRSDNDWQQLHVAKTEPTANKLAIPVPTYALSRPQQSAQQVSPTSDSAACSQSSAKALTGSTAEFWANQVLYVGHLSDGQEQELLTFRELFLHSYALEDVIVGMHNMQACKTSTCVHSGHFKLTVSKGSYCNLDSCWLRCQSLFVAVIISCPEYLVTSYVVVGYVHNSPGSAEERNLLIELFGLCLSGDTAAHTGLVDALLNVSAVEAECRTSGTAASLGPQQPPLASVVAETICGIKLQVSSCGFLPACSLYQHSTAIYLVTYSPTVQSAACLLMSQCSVAVRLVTYSPTVHVPGTMQTMLFNCLLLQWQRARHVGVMQLSSTFCSHVTCWLGMGDSK